ncbi:MAG: cytidylate kinase family protein [Thermodesulfobacteriota bacterium]
MSIVTISRGSYSRGKEVAEKVAKRLGYACIARDILVEASKDFNIPEIKLVRAIHDAPSILDRFGYRKEKYVAYIQKALLQQFQKDRVVYHGLAGHFFLKGVSHVLKVRILAEMEDRVKLEKERHGISEKEARRMLELDDEERRRWSLHLYGIDTGDPRLYDLVIHIKKISVDDAAEIICNTVGLKDFQTTPESQKGMDDLVLSAEVKALLVDLKPDIEVAAKDGIVHIATTVPESQEETLVRKILATVKGIQGVRDLKVHTRSSIPYGD